MNEGFQQGRSYKHKVGETICLKAKSGYLDLADPNN